MRRYVPVWRKIYSILLIYRTLWKLDLNNLYGAWFNIMTQQKVVVNLAFKYTHEVCVQNHANYLKLHYFPRHTWVTPVKINISDVRCPSVGRIARPKFEFLDEKYRFSNHFWQSWIFVFSTCSGDMLLSSNCSLKVMFYFLYAKVDDLY